MLRFDDNKEYVYVEGTQKSQSHRRADLPCPPMHARSPLTTAARRRRKSYDRSSLRRTAHLTHRSVLKDLGIVGKDGKINEDAM